MEGNLAEAGRAYTEALPIGRAAGNTNMAIIANANLADILMEQGHLHRAAGIYSETLQMPTGATQPGQNVGRSR